MARPISNELPTDLQLWGDMASQPELFWGLIVSMWIGNLMLVILNLPLVGIWVRPLRVPYRLLFPSIIMFCCIGN